MPLELLGPFPFHFFIKSLLNVYGKFFVVFWLSWAGWSGIAGPGWAGWAGLGWLGYAKTNKTLVKQIKTTKMLYCPNFLNIFNKKQQKCCTVSIFSTFSLKNTQNVVLSQ